VLILVQLNRPKTLNAFGDRLGDEVVMALRELNEHPDTIFTVLTGKGRFFSSGADVRGTAIRQIIVGESNTTQAACRWARAQSSPTPGRSSPP